MLGPFINYVRAEGEGRSSKNRKKHTELNGKESVGTFLGKTNLGIVYVWVRFKAGKNNS